MTEARNKIGFKTSTQVEQEAIEKRQTGELAQLEAIRKEIQKGKSMSHINLLSRIEQMQNVIASDEFGDYDLETRRAYVASLIDTVALEAELSAKNSILRV